MKALRKFEIGSSLFFGDIPGYKAKDLDELHIMDDFVPGQNVLHLFDGKKDIIMTRDMNKQEFMADALTSGVPMRAGKFLSPMFAAYLEMSISDLQKLDSLFANMDEKHTYEFIIYKAYLQNGGWYLTESQKMEAYQEYRRTRNYI